MILFRNISLASLFDRVVTTQIIYCIPNIARSSADPHKFITPLAVPLFHIKLTDGYKFQLRVHIVTQVSMQSCLNVRRLARAWASINGQHYGSKRSLSTSFAELYRQSVESALLQPGDALTGHVVGRRRPRSSSSRFYVIDFGLKSEAPFTPREIPGASVVGDEVTMPLLQLEDDFNEPVFDYGRRVEFPSVQAERYSLLTKTAKNDVRLLHGRFASFKKGGASVKILGADAFAPRHHVVAVDRPILGSYAPFYLLSMSAIKRPTGTGLDLNPIVSSYGGFLFCLANLVGRDELWEESSERSSKERLGYLQLLSRILALKNTSVRRILPRSGENARRRRERRREISDDDERNQTKDVAWLSDLPRGEWASSGARGEHESSRTISSARAWDRMRMPFPKALQKAKINNNDANHSLNRAPRGRKAPKDGYRRGALDADESD